MVEKGDFIAEIQEERRLSRDCLAVRLSFAKNRQEYLAQRKRRKAAAAEEEAGVGVEEEQQAASRELL